MVYIDRKLKLFLPLTEKGLPPLPDISPSGAEDVPRSEGKSESPVKEKSNSKSKAESAGLSFSSGRGAKPTTGKRKAVGSLVEPDDGASEKEKRPKKKVKKNTKALLSFGDDA